MASPTTIDQVCQTLSGLAPLRLAESWDNVGLLVGNRAKAVRRVMTCLTISPSVVAEAVEQSVDLIVTHHPLPFKPLQRLTDDSVSGKMLLDLIGANVAVYSAHTAYDSAVDGINQQWAVLLELTASEPLAPSDPVVPHASPADPVLGAGRCGRFERPVGLADLAGRAAGATAAENVRYVGRPDQQVNKVAIACGSGGGFLDLAIRKGCDAMVTGEATFHVCLEAESRGVGLVLLGHYASERFAMEAMVDKIVEQHPGLTAWACRNEADPIRAL